MHSYPLTCSFVAGLLTTSLLLVTWSLIPSDLIVTKVSAQVDASQARLSGTITDQSGAVVAEATVTLRSVERGATRTVKTDVNGSYRLPLLEPGLYELNVSAPSFKTLTVRGISLTVGQSAVYELQLSVGEVRAEIQVTTVPPLVETERTQQAETVERSQIANLPNLSRDFTQYIFTLPGVNNAQAARQQHTLSYPNRNSGISIGGSNGRVNYFTIDGGENEFGTGGPRIRNMSIEAVQEFQVNRNAFAAEYGFTAGTAVNVITRSGTNQYHGSGYLFYRSQKTAARDPFDLTGRKSFEQRIFPGLTLGGPFVKDRAFFFTSYEALKFDIARFRSYTSDPSILGLTGAQSVYLQTLETGPAATETTSRIAANLRAALTATNYPTTMRILQESQGAFTAPSRTHNWTTRIDYQIRADDNLTARFTLSDENNDLLSNDNTEAPSRATRERGRDYTLVSTWAHTFSDRLINQVRVQFAVDDYAQVPHDPASVAVNIPGLIFWGHTNLAPMIQNQERYQFEDLLNWNKAAHNFKFGGSYRPVDVRITNELGFNGVYQFAAGLPLSLAVTASDQATLTGQYAPPADTTLTGLQAFSLGLPAAWSQGFGNATFQGWQHNLGLFAQDSWKVTSRLTLDLGARVDYDGEPEPLSPNAYISPRFGFAWDPWGRGRTVIRGGAGTFFAPIAFHIFIASTLLSDSGEFTNIMVRTLASEGESSAAIWAYGVGLGKLPFAALTESDVRAFGITPAPKQPGRRVADPAADYDNPYSVQANLGMSQQLARDLALEVAYQMYHGVHLPLGIESNYRETGRSVTVPGSDLGYLFGPQLERISPEYSQRIVHTSEGNSIYHGMTASLVGRFGQAAQFRAAYTFSKTIDDVVDWSAFSSPFLTTRRYLDRSISAFDIRHTFVASGVFASPFKAGAGHHWMSRALADITLSPILFLRSGIPFNLFIGGDVNGDLNFTDRPFYAPRNSGEGENFYRVDLRFSKTVFFTRRAGAERMRLEVVAEATNLFNRTNVLRINDTVCGTMQQPGFINGCAPEFLTGPFRFKGQAGLPPSSPLAFVSVDTPRQFQFGLTVAF